MLSPPIHSPSAPSGYTVLAVQGRSGSSKVDDFGTNQKRVYDFLLVGHCDYGPILHRFRDMVTYWLRFLLHFCYPSLIRRPRSLCSLCNFSVKLAMRKLDSWGYPHDRSWSRFGMILDCDRRSDRRTDGRTESIMAKTALCIASYADALSKILYTWHGRSPLFIML